jgi:two-component system nitrogen regulation response regulator GlnG
LIRADVRVIAATHQNLRAKVERGEFRADLLHRLDVVRIHLPPLRERAADVPRLADRFLVESAREMRVASKQLSADAVRALARYPWPGNVRELRNLCQRLVLMAPGPQILRADLPEEVRNSEAAPSVDAGWLKPLADWARQQLDADQINLLEAAKASLEQVLFDEALKLTGGDRQQAARRLGCGRNTLTRKLGPKRSV